MTSVPDIGFEYRPSRWPQALLLAVGALALLAIWISALGPALAVLASVMVIHYVRVSLRRARERRVRTVTWRSDGGWDLALADDTEAEARLAGSRMLAGGIFLRLAWEPRHEAMLALFPDNLAADARRRLRMRLSAEAHKS